MTVHLNWAPQATSSCFLCGQYHCLLENRAASDRSRLRTQTYLRMVAFSSPREMNSTLPRKDGSQPRKLHERRGVTFESRVFPPDGERLVFTVYSHGPISIDEARADGSGLRAIVNTGVRYRTSVLCSMDTPTYDTLFINMATKGGVTSGSCR